MAPTIYTEKKRQPRTGLVKNNHHSVGIASSTPSTRNLTAVSSIFRHVAKGTSGQRSSSTLRIRGSPFHIVSQRGDSSSDVDGAENLIINDDDDNARCHLSHHNNNAMCDNACEMDTNSDSTISSSAYLHNNNNNTTMTSDNDDVRSMTSFSSINSNCSPMVSDSSTSNQVNTANQYSNSMCNSSYESLSTDEDDAEVDAIISAKRTETNGMNCNSSDNINESTEHFKRKQRDKIVTTLCAYNNNRTVFNAPTLSDKKQQSLIYNCNDNLNKNFNQNNTNWTKTYADMCDIKNTEGLLSIAIKTIKLVKRNQLLQRRLAELQLETSEFIQSVLANPENRHFRENMKAKKQKVDLK